MPSDGFERPDPSNEAAADRRLRPHGNRDRYVSELLGPISYRIMLN